MLKPFYNKKKNIDDRLVPAVTADDVGKVLGVIEEGKIAPVEGGGGKFYQHTIEVGASYSYIVIIDNDPTAYNLTRLKTFLTEKNFTDLGKIYPTYTKVRRQTSDGAIQFTYGIAQNSGQLYEKYKQLNLSDGSLTDLSAILSSVSEKNCFEIG